MLENRESTARAAIDQANLNVLRLALYQMTGDEDLTKVRIVHVPVRGGAFFAYVVADEDAQMVKDKALAYLMTDRTGTPVTPPADDRLRRMMALFTGEPLTDGEFALGREELAFDEFPRAAAWSAERPARASDHQVVIIGAGASGIAAGIQFERLGIPYIIVERQADIGGTWHLNHYPDARVDTNSYLYQFKFEKNYPWTEYFASQGEVKRYLEHIAKKYGVYDKIRFNVSLDRAVYDSGRHSWVLDLTGADGEAEQLVANFVISGAGLFSTPKLPDIEGIESFQGDTFHTTAWDDEYSPDGKRIAIIGNGSTGVQVMQGLAETAEQVYVLMRTPQWISPMEGYRELIPDEVKWLFANMPAYWNWYCYSAQTTAAGMQAAQEYDRAWQATGGQIGPRNDALRSALTAYIRTRLGDREDLIEKVTPDYAPLARRLVVDNGWYDALLKPNVELVTEGIARVLPHGIEFVDGRTIEVDTLIVAAGFEVSKYLWPAEYVGVDGRSMEQVWEADGPRAFLGLVVPSFPNLFMFYGPNSQARAGSFLSWIEVWARYAAQAVVDVIDRDARSIAVKQDVFDRYNDVLDTAHSNLIWQHEAPAGRNYYVNKFGRQNVNLPWTLGEYFLMVNRPNPEHFDVV
jgi:4-hydroxyacetophenone monooxygenase